MNSLAVLLLAGVLSLSAVAAPAPEPVKVEAVITAYCLAGRRTASDKIVYPGCLALSRGLARQLGLKRGPGKYDYRFGAKVVVEGVGCFTFDDLMPAKWQRPRVDIHRPTVRQCRDFGLKRRRIWVDG